MDDVSAGSWASLYGLTYFTMGVAVVACASTYPTSSFRNRLLALGAFGLFHAAAAWLTQVFDAQNMLSNQHMDVLYLPRSLALYYFAFGWSERRPLMAHAIVLASTCGLIVLGYLFTEPGYMDLFTRYGVAIPASVSAAVVFAYDSSFRFGSRFSDAARWLVASGFMVYAALHIFTEPTNLFPASVFNRDTFEAATGISARLARSASILVIMIGTLALLNRFGVVMRQQTKNALEAIDAKLNKALDISRLGNWEWNVVTGRSVPSINACTILGVSKNELKRGFEDFLDHVHPDDRAAVRKTVNWTLKKHASYNIHHRIIRPDGTVRYVQSRGEVEVGPDGTAHKVLIVLQDVTQLTEARIAAEAASEAKSNFVSNMSHELRTPLNAILGFSEAIKMNIYGPLGDPRYGEYAADIHRSGKHLLSIINDILSVSRLEAGKAELVETRSIRADKLLNKCARWMEVQALEAGIDLRVVVAIGTPSLRGDVGLLTQALLNLVSNAVKFTPRGGVVELRAEETGAGGVALSVRDTGVGLNADQIARIGEPFLQFDETQRRKFDGTGLGLLITKRLVELHGGKLEVQSIPDIGTTISINMPPERSVRQTLSDTQAA